MPDWYDDRPPEDYAPLERDYCRVCGFDAHQGVCFDDCGLAGDHDTCTHLTPAQVAELIARPAQ